MARTGIKARKLQPTDARDVILRGKLGKTERCSDVTVQSGGIIKTRYLPIQQGEIILLPVAELPEGSTTSHKSYLCAHSESGHNHVLESPTDFDVVVDKEDLYLRLFAPGKLVHQKTFDNHRTLDVPATTYKVVHKTAYDPFETVIRRVRD